MHIVQPLGVKMPKNSGSSLQASRCCQTLYTHASMNTDRHSDWFFAIRVFLAVSKYVMKEQGTAI